jgi:O-acetyl-ADP-ribose deacetylase
MSNGITVIDGSLAKLGVDAILLGSNTSVSKGNLISRDAHRAAGPMLDPFRQGLSDSAKSGVIVTPGFSLPAEFVIHITLPTLRVGEELTGNHQASWQATQDRILELVSMYGFKTVAIPPVGVDEGLPVAFALTALATLAHRLSQEAGSQIFLVSKEVQHRRAWNLALKKLGQE